MQEAKNLKMYRQECHESLENDYLRTALDKFAIAYKESRGKAFAGFDVVQLIDEIAQMKDDGLLNLDQLYEQFKTKAEAGGVTVHYAKDADEANRIIIDIARAGNCELIATPHSRAPHGPRGRLSRSGACA